MAKFYKQKDGSYGLRHGLSANEPIPADAEVVEFDETANAGLLDSLCGKNGFRWQDHSIVSGVIQRAGSPVSIAADSPDVADRKDFDAQVPAMLSRVAAIKTAADAGFANAAARDAAIGDLAQMLRRTLRIVNQLRKI